MGNNEKATILKSYIVLKNKLIFYNNRLYNVKGVSFEEKKGGYNNKTIIDDIMERDKIANQIKAIETAVNKLPTMERLLIQYIYYIGLTIREIEGRRLIPYSYSQLKRIKKNALNLLNMSHNEP